MKKEKKEEIITFGLLFCGVTMIGVLILLMTPTQIETVTIGNVNGTIINRTQEVGCNSDLIHVKSEVYTGIVVDVIVVDALSNTGKIVFEDGYVLMAQKVNSFMYKLGSEHIIVVDIWNRGRIVEEVTILN